MKRHSPEVEFDIRGVLFDLDNTLYDRDLAFEKWTCGFVEEQFATENAERRAEIVQQIVVLDEQGRVTKTSLFTQARALYPTITQEVEALCERFYQEWLVHMTLDVETQEVLEALDAVNLPFGIITNGPLQQNLKVRRLGLESRIRCLFISEAFGCSKPEAAIFRAAATALNVPCRHILFVGDNPEADICGANAVGMRSMWLHRGTTWPATLPHVEPDYVIDSLGELLPLFSRAS